MLQQIEEPCSLGVHAAVVIPPTWILRARRPQVSPSCTLDTPPLGVCQPPQLTHLVTNVLLPSQNTLKASKKKKRASFKRKSSKKGPEVRPGARRAAGGNGREEPVSWKMSLVQPLVGHFGLWGPEEDGKSDLRVASLRPGPPEF